MNWIDTLKQTELIVIGDVHGKLDNYEHILNAAYHAPSVQLGDFGFKKEHDWFIENVDSSRHNILFGNHDYYPYLFHEHSIGDYLFDTDLDFGMVRGAYSIDQYLRTPGIDYFDNEELSYAGMQEAVDMYVAVQPRVMITHDCPQYVREYLFNIQEKSITSNGLQVMHESWQPELWIFGHHHKSIDVKIEGTRFVCLNELETYIVDL